MSAGRRSKLTPTLREGILEALRQGNSRTAASQAMGVTREALRLWIAKDLALLADIEKAEAYAEQEAVKRITAAFGFSWQSAAWWLERRKPHEWGKVDRVEVTIREHAEKIAGDLGVPVEDIIREAEMIAAGHG